MDLSHQEQTKEFFTHKIINDQYFITPSGLNHKIDLTNSSEFYEEMVKGEEKGYTTLHVDFENIKYIDSSGLGKLIAFSKRVKLILHHVNEDIKKLMELTHISILFTFE